MSQLLGLILTLQVPFARRLKTWQEMARLFCARSISQARKFLIFSVSFSVKIRSRAFSDTLLLLSMGRCVFLGPKNEAKKFFESTGNPCRENYNPADHYIWETSVLEGKEELSRNKILKIWDSFNASDWKKEVAAGQVESIKSDPMVTDVVDEAKANKANWFVSFYMLLWRALISQYRDKSTAGMKFGQNIGTAIIVGLVYLRIPWSKLFTLYL